MPTTPTPITALPAAPDRADRSTFSARATAMFTALKDSFVGEANALASVTNDNAIEAAAAALTASSAATSAGISEQNAAASAGAAMWVSGTTYTLGAAVWSPVDRLVYRRIIAGAGTTDPSADLTNWARMSIIEAIFLDKGNSGTTAQVINYSAANHQKITTTGAFTLSITNWPLSGKTGELFLELVNGGSSVITWPTINWVKSDGTTTTTFSANGVTLQSSGTDFALLWSRDGGTTVYGRFMR